MDGVFLYMVDLKISAAVRKIKNAFCLFRQTTTYIVGFWLLRSHLFVFRQFSLNEQHIVLCYKNHITFKLIKFVNMCWGMWTFYECTSFINLCPISLLCLFSLPFLIEINLLVHSVVRTCCLNSGKLNNCHRQSLSDSPD